MESPCVYLSTDISFITIRYFWVEIWHCEYGRVTNKMKHFQWSQFQLIPLLNKYNNCFPFVCISRLCFYFIIVRKLEVFSFKIIPYLCQLLVSQLTNSIINVGKSTIELVIPVISSVAILRWSSFSLHWLWMNAGLTGQHSKCWILAHLVSDLTNNHIKSVVSSLKTNKL